MPYYPVNEFGPLMKGMVIGGLGIFHVFLAQFAIGGGFLLCYFQWLAQSRREPAAERFVKSYFQFLVLVSFVLGALSGVGMWFIAIQVSPRTIGWMVDEFHWVWITEWTFFCVEIVSGYAFYRYQERLSQRARMALLVVYSLAAWFSLFWINGILSWQLTPGEWLRGGGVWAGFFNPGFWPSLLYRTVVCLTIAALVACVVINALRELDRPARARLIHRAAVLLLPMAVMPLLGLWYISELPRSSRAWTLGGSPAMTLFLFIAVGSSALIGLYAFFGLWYQRLYINGATATLLCALALAATAAGEFVREGLRKPYTIHGALYANSITPAELRELRRTGSVSDDRFPLRDAPSYPNDQLRLGAKVYRLQCSVCHTVSGANGLVHLIGSWSQDQMRMNIAKLQLTKPFMPPFAGNAEELEALVQLLSWRRVGRPAEWLLSKDAVVLDWIRVRLEEAGTEPRLPRDPVHESATAGGNR